MGNFSDSDWCDAFKLDEIFKSKEAGDTINIPKATGIERELSYSEKSPSYILNGIVSLCERVNNPEVYGWKNSDELKELKEFCNSNKMLEVIDQNLAKAWECCYNKIESSVPFSQVNKQLELIQANEGDNLDKKHDAQAQYRLYALSQFDASDRLVILLQEGKRESYAEVNRIKDLLADGANPNIDYDKPENLLWSPSLMGRMWKLARRSPLECARNYRNVSAGIATDGGIMAFREDAYYELTDAFLKAGADPNYQNADGKTALFYAFECGNLQVIQRLERANANFGIKDKSGKIAIDYCKDEKIQTLYESKMKEIKKELQGETLKALVKEEIATKKKAIIERLYENAKDKTEFMDRTDAVLMSKGEKTSQQEYWFHRFKEVISKPDKQEALVDDFLCSGQDVNIDLGQGIRPLMCLTNLDAMKKLLNNGADINATTLTGNTVLDMLPHKRDVDIFLLNSGANLLIEPYEGVSWYEYAKQEKYPDDKEILDLLETKKKEIMFKQIQQKVRTEHYEISGTVVADKIAEGIRSGVITEPVTPKEGKALSENVKRKYVTDKIRSDR